MAVRFARLTRFNKNGPVCPVRITCPVKLRNQITFFSQFLEVVRLACSARLQNSTVHDLALKKSNPTPKPTLTPKMTKSI